MKKTLGKTLGKTGKRRVQFSVQAPPGSTVSVAGTFNGWDPRAKPLKDKEGTGVFRGCLNLAPGVYAYKLVINGEWCVDPGCRDWEKNDLGTLNSVLHVE